MLVYLFVMYIKNLLKFPLVCDIAVVISFSYPAYDITTFLLINTYLAGDFFREPKADFCSIEGLINTDMV